MKANNWASWEAFSWSDKPEDAHMWSIVNIRNRDSNALDRSNARIIEREIPECDDVRYETHGHWAVGHVTALCIRTGTPSEAAYDAIAAQLEEYPVLDDEDFAAEETSEADAVWRDCYSQVERIEYLRRELHRLECIRTFADLMGAARGNYFPGDASEIIEP